MDKAHTSVVGNDLMEAIAKHAAITMGMLKHFHHPHLMAILSPIRTGLWMRKMRLPPTHNNQT